MAANIIFKLGVLTSKDELIKFTEAVEDDGSCDWDYLKYYAAQEVTEGRPVLCLKILHERDSQIHGYSADAYMTEVHISYLLRTYKISLRSYNSVALRLYGGENCVVYLLGGEKEASNFAIGYTAGLDQASLTKILLLTALKAWSENGGFKNEEVWVTGLVDPDELPRWEENPEYFVL